MNKICQEKFDYLLIQHQLYVESFGKEGKDIRLDDIDFSGVNISNTSLTDAFITKSVLKNNLLDNVEIFDAKLCGCVFENVVFKNVNFVKTDLSYCHFLNCKFLYTKIKRCESIETIFRNSKFFNCDLYDFFSYAELDGVLFADMDMARLIFYETIIKNVQLKDVKNMIIDEAVISLNIGTFDNIENIKDERAIEYFKQNITYL